MPTPFCMTPDEASAKWCPFSSGRPDGSTYNCVASNCMAWRFAKTNIDDGNGGLKPSGDTHGYCGAAGPHSAA